MMRVDDQEEVFFDCVNDLPSLGPVDVSKETAYSDFGFGIWLNEPQSVEKRRESFLSDMGFVISTTSQEEEKIDCDSITIRLENSGAVPSCSSSSVDGNKVIENTMFNHCRELNGEANYGTEDLVQELLNGSNLEKMNISMDKKKLRKWWRGLINRSEKTLGTKNVTKNDRVKVRYNKKSSVELSGVFLGQELQAHVGLIWCMKFSPDGRFLATGGEDGVVRVWCVNMVGSSGRKIHSQNKSSSGKDKWNCSKIVVPEKIFQIVESPLQQFFGHTSDVLDLTWSKSNCLLSSSKDKTVRLWQVGCDQCLHVFQHNDYVTCVQFNPCDENYFLSGSIDGKVRIWGVCEKRVINWADVRDVISAISYQPDGKGFLVGSVTGTCSFFDASDGNVELNARIRFGGRKKSFRNKITGILFTQEDSQRVIITSEDSKVRILDGIEIVQKYRGRARSGTQMSASVTSSGGHIISVGEDSRVYLWNYDELTTPSSKQTPSSRSCEHFFSEGISVAASWPGIESNQIQKYCVGPHHHLDIQDPHEASSWRRDSAYFSLTNWFSTDALYRNTSTWPEETLPTCKPDHGFYNKGNIFPETWGLVIVTAGRDGFIRTFHNYGFPVVV